MATRRSKAAAVSKATQAIGGRKRDLHPPSGRPLAAARNDEPPADDADDAARGGIRLGFLIHDVSRMRRSAYDQFMKPLGITRAQWWVLAHLSRHDGMMQTQLADVLEVGKASLGDVIEGLESGGWVERRPDPSDKRAKRVYLTRPAQGLIKRMTLMEHDFNSQILRDLSAAERLALIRSLLKIKHALVSLGPGLSAPELDT